MINIRYITSMLLVALFTAGLMTVGQSMADVEFGKGVRLATGCDVGVNYKGMTDQQIREVFPD